jgi:hypothetical protein
MALTRESIAAMANKPRRVEAVEVPGMGDVVHVRVMTAGERIKMLDSIPEDAPAGESNLHMVAATLCDESGNRVLSESESDLELIKSMPADVVQRIVDKASALNGFSRGNL